MIKWEKPILVPLQGVTRAQGLCETGSGDIVQCVSVGNSAGVKCRTGNSADPECGEGNAPVVFCGIGNQQPD